jgi:hypothetical protein
MIHQKPKERKAIGKRNGLNVYSTLKNNSKGLKAKTKLKSKVPIKVITPKQKKLNQSWNALTDIRYEQTEHLCEWCETWGSRDRGHPLFMDGHHIERRAKGNYILSNLYIIHRYQCHRFVTDNNINCYEFRCAREWNLAHPEKQFKLK